MKYEDRMKRSGIVAKALQELFPTASEVLKSDDFFTGDFLFQVNWGEERRCMNITIKVAEIDHVVSDLVLQKEAVGL